MIKRLKYLPILATIFITSSESAIRVNQVAYDLDGPKNAVIDLSDETVETDSFSLVDENGEVVFSNKLSEPQEPVGWGGPFAICDFSSFKKPGNYSVKYGDSSSVRFKIDENALVAETYKDAVTFFTGMRNTNDDSHVPVFGSPDVFMSVNGGWNDASGDRGKYLSHLAYANFFPPQQIPFVIWSLLKSLDLNKDISSDFKSQIISEAAWGADYLCRIMNPDGFFYINVFDKWGWGEREVCAWYYNAADPNPDMRSGVKTTDYQAAFREGGGVSIAALAHCARLGVSGELSSEYLANAKKAYDHLKEKNLSYCDDGVENIIDDYCALLAAIELYKATTEKSYLTDATSRVESLLSRVSDKGFFWSDKDSKRPFYHAADEGLPVVALLEYIELVPQDAKKVKDAIRVILRGYGKQTFEVPNPFAYPRINHVPPVSFVGENNIASGKPVTVSQVQNGYLAESACDGNVASRWASGEPYSDTEWVVIDLGGLHEVSSVVLNWEAAYGKMYDIMVSNDNKEWKTVFAVENGVPGVNVHKFDPVSCQYVKMQGRERGIEYGFSLYEFEIYGSIKNTGKSEIDVSYFMPHKNETGYWWQGENARISSISTAIYLSWNAGVDIPDTLLGLASSNLDWILGKNPFGVCMMFGKGVLNYPNYPGISAFPNVNGGICNGITASDSSDSPIWKPYDDGNTDNWRWIEQWLPHNAWYVLAVSSQGAVEWDNVPDKIRVSRAHKNGVAAVKHRISNNKLNLTFSKKDRGVCTISTLSGKIVSKQEFDNTKSNNVTIPLNSISNGMYVVQINGKVVQQSIPVFLHN